MSRRVVLLAALLPLSVTLACEGRGDRLAREMAYTKREGDAPVELPPDIPPHPTRDKLAPFLAKLYSQDKLPDVMEADIEPNPFKYELQPGVLSVVRLQKGLSSDDQVRAIVLAVAEADAWAYRSTSRRPYADQVHRVGRGYGEDQKQLILKAYADLKLLDFFNGPDAAALIAALPGDVKGPVEALKNEYLAGKQGVWDRWMGVKMYARRVVSGDEPFRSVLRGIKKEMGMEEPPPRNWVESMDGPFKAWAQEVQTNEDLVSRLTNLRELKEREDFMNDTHATWAIEGSEIIPPKAKGTAADATLGFAAKREDLGGGYNDMTYIFSKKLKGDALKYAYLQSIIYGSLLSDFGLLATAGGDFAEREDGRIDPKTAVVPDKYDPLYAKCGSQAALDTLITHWRDKIPFLAGMKPRTSAAEKILETAHKCVIEGAAGEIWVPDPKDDKDVEGPAPGSRLGLYQMLARYENIDVNMARMADERTEEDDEIEAGEAVLKRIKEEQNAGKGTK